MELLLSVRPLFEQAGWHPDRQVEPSIRYVNTPSYLFGRKILANLQGLHVGKSGPGRDCAASDIHFDPSEAADCLEYTFAISDYSLCPLASYHNSHGVLYVDGSGALYAGDFIGDSGITLISRSFHEGLTNILLGIKLNEDKSLKCSGTETVACLRELRSHQPIVTP